MKFLIWAASYLVLSLVLTALTMNGISLGGIPMAVLFALTTFVARKISKMWDERH